MDLTFLGKPFFLGFGDAANFIPTEVPQVVAFDPLTMIVIGAALIIATIFIIFFLKKVITNSIIGGIIWAVAIFVFQVDLPLIPSFIISIVIGPAGIGTMLLLQAFGLLVI